MRASRVLATLAIFALAGGLCSSVSGNPAGAGPLTLTGTVETAGTPLDSYAVTLLATGSAGPSELGTATSDAAGEFEIPYVAPVEPGAVLWIEAVSPPAVRLVNVLGVAPVPGAVVINEPTTVASAYGMAQFTAGGAVSGPSPGVPNAVGMVHNLADPVTGAVADVLASPPNGNRTSTRDKFNSLANMVAACVDAPANCTSLFAAATTPDGVVPTDSFSAIGNVARNAWFEPGGLFTQSTLAPAPYQPALGQAPHDWSLALRFVGDGVTMDGPGNFVADHEGNIWATNNYTFSRGSGSVCGGPLLLRFAPNGEYVPGSPYAGGGVMGQGYGIVIDPFGDVWSSNFGFAGEGCPPDQLPDANSITQSRFDGSPISPSASGDSQGGWTQGNLDWPMGIESSPEGSIWITNCRNDSVTIYPNGDPNRATNVTGLGIEKPFDVSLSTTGLAVVTGIHNSKVAVLNPDGSPVPGSPLTGFDRPMGVVADSQGYSWVNNSGFLDAPCPTPEDLSAPNGGYLTLIDPNGAVVLSTPRFAGGLTIPFGNSVDGADNVWAANFRGIPEEQRLSHFCGVPEQHCPPGVGVGEPIAPDGYEFEGLTRNTGALTDPSGNVWVANNWKRVPVPTNPGGYQVVVFVGLGTPRPVAPPISRPPRPVPIEPTFTG